jgi:NAD(P)-dependent dehydrogenase (short-subunit alcohol dehydrogenase family)
MMSEQQAAFVAGGSSGIGKAAALLLARRGYAVLVADRDEDGGRAVVEAIGAAGGKAFFARTDVLDEASVRDAVETALARFGRLDVAINSAGVPQAGKALHELTLDEWDRCNGINLRGMFLCMKHQLRAMVAGGGGAIVAISSAAAEKGLVHSADYCASKAGILGLVRSSAVDYAPRGIRINALLPGGTDTPLATRSQAANPKLAGTLTVPMGRMAAPDEIAAAAVWLVSPEASYLTGAALAADGGMTAA